MVTWRDCFVDVPQFVVVLRWIRLLVRCFEKLPFVAERLPDVEAERAGRGERDGGGEKEEDAHDCSARRRDRRCEVSAAASPLRTSVLFEREGLVFV